MGLLDVADGALAFPYKELEGYNDDDAEADAEELLVVWLKNEQKIVISFHSICITLLNFTFNQFRRIEIIKHCSVTAATKQLGKVQFKKRNHAKFKSTRFS